MRVVNWRGNHSASGYKAVSHDCLLWSTTRCGLGDRRANLGLGLPEALMSQYVPTNSEKYMTGTRFIVTCTSGSYVQLQLALALPSPSAAGPSRYSMGRSCKVVHVCMASIPHPRVWYAPLEVMCHSLPIPDGRALLQCSPRVALGSHCFFFGGRLMGSLLRFPGPRRSGCAGVVALQRWVGTLVRGTPGAPAPRNSKPNSS